MPCWITPRRGKGRIGGGRGYEHGIGTYALAEAYYMTKDNKVKKAIRDAVPIIINGQGSDGGWMYGLKQVTPSDTSVSGWMIQALKTTYLAEINIPGIEDSLKKAAENLDRVYKEKDGKGTFGYRKPGDRDKNISMTGVGALCKMFIEGEQDEKVEKALKSILAQELDYQGKHAHLYSWYYDTQACFQAQGRIWPKWNNMFQKQLIDNQSADGSWPPTGGKEHGKMNEIGPDENVYRTTLCILMLEVYYRYSPVSKLAD
jgi:hypothetical protein